MPEAICSIIFSATLRSRLWTGAASPQGTSLLMADLRFANRTASYIHDSTAEGSAVGGRRQTLGRLRVGYDAAEGHGYKRAALRRTAAKRPFCDNHFESWSAVAKRTSRRSSVRV
jgi:hypothetical protein